MLAESVEITLSQPYSGGGGRKHTPAKTAAKAEKTAAKAGQESRPAEPAEKKKEPAEAKSR